MSYKIKKISIRDFKLFKEKEFLYDFTGKNLIVLDGPNGYGKTTLFDALELVFSGKIHRLDKSRVTDRTVDQPDFYSNGFKIKIELVNEESRLNFGLICNSQTNNKRLLDWHNLEIYILKNFDDDIKTGQKLQRDIQNGKIIGNDAFSDFLGEASSLNRFFDYYYYIQQEESTFYLKQNEKERSKEIESLFDTGNETEELNKLDRIYQLLSNYLKKKRQELQTFKDNIPHSEIDQQKNKENTEYNALLSKMNNSPFWDVKDLDNLTSEALDKAKYDLKIIMDLTKGVIEYKKYREVIEFNKIIKRIVDDQALINQLTLDKKLLINFEKIQKSHSSFLEITKVLKKLNSDDWIEDLGIKDLETVQQIVPIDYFDINLIDLKVRIVTLFHKTNATEKLKIELLSTRDTFINQIREISTTHIHGISTCPLCGFNWVTWDKLLESFKEYEKKLQEQLKIDNKEFSKLIHDWQLKIEPLKKWLLGYINDEANQIDESIYELLVQANKNNDTLSKCLKWLSEQEISIAQLNKQQLNKIFNSVYSDELKKYLTLEIKSTSQFIFSSIHNELFEKYFESNITNLEKIDPEKVSSKERYIERQFYLAIEKKRKELKILETEIELIDKYKNQTEEIKQIYRDEIIKHHQQILKNIEIPLFIYSSKILHGYKSEGSIRTEGIRMDDDTTQENEHKNLRLRFIPNVNGNAHDVTYTLSSGQISGLVIAFTLALNKIYGSKKNGIGFLLIDDPVQSMDDINMSALVDLLRQEFKEKQLIISTHEEDFSRYIRYRFNNFGLSYTNINMKDDYLKHSV